jgi:hypothetical protein
MKPTTAPSNRSCVLGNGFAVLEFEECSKVGPHLPPFLEWFEKARSGCPSIDFESELIAAGHLVSDFLLLARHHFFAALGRGRNPG